NRAPPQVSHSSLFSDLPSISSSVACNCRTSSFIPERGSEVQVVSGETPALETSFSQSRAGIPPIDELFTRRVGSFCLRDSNSLLSSASFKSGSQFTQSEKR